MNENRIEKIKQRLQILSPTHLDVIDESAAHYGHPGAATGMGHFAITIAAPAFKDQTAVKCHQLVYQALRDLMETDIHAVNIKIVQNRD